MTFSVRQLSWVISNKLNTLAASVWYVELKASCFHLPSLMVMCVLVTLMGPEFSRDQVTLSRIRTTFSRDNIYLLSASGVRVLFTSIIIVFGQILCHYSALCSSCWIELICNRHLRLLLYFHFKLRVTNHELLWWEWRRMASSTRLILLLLCLDACRCTFIFHTYWHKKACQNFKVLIYIILPYLPPVFYLAWKFEPCILGF